MGGGNTHVRENFSRHRCEPRNLIPAPGQLSDGAVDDIEPLLPAKLGIRISKIKNCFRVHIDSPVAAKV